MVFFGPKVTSQQIPEDPTFTPSPILLKKIQAFHTITTFLGQLNRQAPLKPYDPLKDQDVKREQLDEIHLCDAFAHLAVYEHDVVALATNRNEVDLKILACAATSSVDKDKDGPPDDTPKPTFLEKCWTFCCTKNTRFDDVKSTTVTTHPSIIEAKKPVGYREGLDGLGNETLYKYLIDLEKNW